MRVGNVLVKQDFISEEMLQRALTIQKRTNQKIGEILVGMGLIGEDTISDSLKTQAVEVVLSLFKWKKGEYNFKIMEHLDRSMKMIEPIQTDNIIMEGVQMLDEWPLIKKLIPDETIIFEPVPVQTKYIEILDDYEEEPTSYDKNKIYLNDTEADLLKYINGKHSVIDLVEMGIFTEYKVYKSLFNLLNKSIIKVKEKTPAEEGKEERLKVDLKPKPKNVINKFFNALLILLLLIFVYSVFKPLRPFKKENVILKTELYKNIFPETINTGKRNKNPGQ
jgi:hypothetical protein